MGKWKEVELGTLIEVKYGKDHKKLKEGEIPCFGSGGLMRKVEKAIYDKKSILIPRKGSLNNIMFQNNPFWTVDTMFWSKIDEVKVVPKFLFYQMTLIDYTALNVGSAVPSLTVPVINEIAINLPPLPEQKAIAEVLSSLDDKIDLLHRQNQTLEQMAATLFRQWFVEEADDDLPLTDFIDINPRLSLKKGEEAPYLEMKNVHTNSANPIDWYNRAFKSGTRFQNGDTLMARITPCLENGKTCYVQFMKEQEIGWGSTEFLVFRTKNPFPNFCSYLLANNSDFRDFAVKTMTGSSGRQRIQTDSLKQYKLGKPSLENLKAMQEQMPVFAAKIAHNFHQIRTLENLRDTLLPKFMNGTIRMVDV